MINKRMALWAHDNSIQVEDGDRIAFYKHVTPSSFDRFEKLTWHVERLRLSIAVAVGGEGLLFVAVDRRR